MNLINCYSVIVDNRLKWSCESSSKTRWRLNKSRFIKNWPLTRVKDQTYLRDMGVLKLCGSVEHPGVTKYLGNVLFHVFRVIKWRKVLAVEERRCVRCSQISYFSMVREWTPLITMINGYRLFISEGNKPLNTNS